MCGTDRARVSDARSVFDTCQRTFDLRDDVLGGVLADDISDARDDSSELVEIGHIGALGRGLGVLLHHQLA